VKQLLAWLKAMYHWLAEWRFFCLGLFAVVIPIGLIVLVCADESVIRIAGMVLQLMGIGTVAWGIHITRKQFGHPSIFTVWRKRLNRCPAFGNRGGTGSGSGTLPALTSNGYSGSSVSADTNQTIDARIQALEKNLRLVNDRVSRIQYEMGQEFLKQTASLMQEQKIRSDEDQHIRAKMESTSTGGLHISAMGTLWLVVGVIMSSIPSELAVWFK
jgi:hypothetical protein